jgi:hypothetical protein
MLSTLKTRCVNGLIAYWLALLFVQTCPGVPDWLSRRPQILANATGTWQGPWDMFAPNPDSKNHRVRAVIEYHDGNMLHWQSPDWPEQSIGERFVSHRRSGYINALQYIWNREALVGLADWLARTQRHDFTSRPKSVQIYLDYYVFPDPRLHGWNWQPPEGAVRYEHKALVFQGSFP